MGNGNMEGIPIDEGMPIDEVSPEAEQADVFGQTPESAMEEPMTDTAGGETLTVTAEQLPGLANMTVGDVVEFRVEAVSDDGALELSMVTTDDAGMGPGVSGIAEEFPAGEAPLPQGV